MFHGQFPADILSGSIWNYSIISIVYIVNIYMYNLAYSVSWATGISLVSHNFSHVSVISTSLSNLRSLVSSTDGRRN